MSFNDTTFKKCRVLIILIISMTLFASMTFVASASTTLDIQDPEGKYTIKFTFPNGDVVGYDSEFHMEKAGEDRTYTKIIVDKTWENQQTGIDVKIEVEGVDINDWTITKRGYPLKGYRDSINEFTWGYAPYMDYDYTQLQYYIRPYFVCIDRNTPKGSACLGFFFMAEEDETDDYFVVPAYEEIECSEEIEFTLKKERNGIYSDVDDSEVEWIVGQSESLSEFRDNIIIGTIDNAGLLSSDGGLFTSQNIGTCTVFARVDGEIKGQSEVVVKCPCDDEGDLEEVIRLYKQRIPENPYQQELNEMYRYDQLINPSSPFSPGRATNMYSIINSDYEEFTCGAYQYKVLVFLSNMQSTIDECDLLNGYDFGPIEGAWSAHHAVVVYPEGTDWKKTGTVFDPWPQQKPEVMSISDWEKNFSHIAGDTSPAYRYEYNTTKDPNDYHYALWTTAGEFAQRMGALVGFGNCPVNILITDSSGRQMGAVGDDEMVFDIPNAFITRMSDGEGGYQWYFTLPITDEYDVDITAFDDGDFEFFVMNSNTEQLQDYGKHSINNKEVAEVELSSQDPTTPMILPDGSEVVPTLEEVVVPDISDTTPTAEEKGLPGFELWVASSMVFTVMMFRRS